MLSYSEIGFFCLTESFWFKTEQSIIPPKVLKSEATAPFSSEQ